MDEIRIRLEQDHFAILVLGGEVVITQGDTKIRMILADIGFDQMIHLIDRAENERK